MALWGDKKVSELEAHLLQENADLKKQVERLQEALIAKESPIAYAQMRMDQANAEDPVDLEERERIKERNEFARRYAARIEEPFFIDADDMISKLSQVIGVPTPKSLHGNEES
jgi:hypothetical protein